MSWWFDNSEGNRWNPNPTKDVVYGPEIIGKIANTRIYYAPTTPRGIVVDRDLPPDVLERAQEEEQRRRDNANTAIAKRGRLSWLEQDSQD